MVNIIFGSQIGQNVVAYIDNIIMKGRKEDDHLQDLGEAFCNLRKVGLHLNLEKCIFGVCSGKLLGFLISHRGIEANPKKI